MSTRSLCSGSTCDAPLRPALPRQACPLTNSCLLIARVELLAISSRECRECRAVPSSHCRAAVVGPGSGRSGAPLSPSSSCRTSTPAGAPTLVVVFHCLSLTVRCLYNAVSTLVRRDGLLSLDEFCKFCEEMIYKGKDLDFIQQRAKGFLEVVDRKESQRQDMWKARAHQVTTPAQRRLYIVDELPLQRCVCTADSCATACRQPG